MTSLAKGIVTVIVDEYGRAAFLKRISDPLWFQALGCVLGYDWHSSGVTTVLTGVLKQAVVPEEHGFAVCGGKGRASRQTPSEIAGAGEKFGLSDDKVKTLCYASKMSAKVDNTAIQAGYQLYQHAETANNTPFLNYLAHLEKIHMRHRQLRNINWILSHLNKHTNLDNPTEVNEYISTRDKSESYKAHLVQVYAKYCQYQNIPYTRPKYNCMANKQIKIPTEEKINMIISDSGKTLATKLTLSKETGMRPVEVHTLKVKDIDLQQHLVYPTTAKHGTPRTLRISNALASLLLAHIIRNKLNPNDKMFKGTEDHYGTSFTRTRNRLANKIADPTLKTIRLYDLRHFFATMLYHKTREILEVKRQLGHKYIEHTLIYIDLEASIFNFTDEWICKTAKTPEEAIQLIQTGFEKADTMGEIHIYRKRK